MARAASREALLDLLGPVVTTTGCDLEDIEVTPAGKRRVVRVTVDRDGGVPLDVVAEVSTAVSAAFDAAEPFGESPYVLEVSSPGVSRPLTLPRHWRRNTGRLVEVVVAHGPAVTGRIISVAGSFPATAGGAAASDAGDVSGEGSVVLDVAGTQRTVAFGDLGAGHVQVEFSRPGAEGHIDDDDLDIHDDDSDDDIHDDSADNDSSGDDSADNDSSGEEA